MGEKLSEVCHDVSDRIFNFSVNDPHGYNFIEYFDVEIFRNSAYVAFLV